MSDETVDLTLQRLKRFETRLDTQGEVDLASKQDLREMEARLNATISELKCDLVKWVTGMMLAQVAVVAALVKPL